MRGISVRDMELIQAAIDGATNQALYDRFRLRPSYVMSILSEARSAGYPVLPAVVRERNASKAATPAVLPAERARASAPPAKPTAAIGPTVEKSSLRELVERGVPATQIAALLRLPYAEVQAIVDAVGHSAGFAVRAGEAVGLRPKPLTGSHPYHGAYNG